MGKVKDCVALAENVKVNRYYDMTMNDANKMFDAYGNDPARLLFESFKYGYVQGQKAARQEAKEKAAVTP